MLSCWKLCSTDSSIFRLEENSVSEPFLGEIRIVAFNYPPKGWALCNGQTMPINQFQALFALLGTTFGGNGINNFLLPNLQGNVVVGAGSGPGLSPYNVGQIGGEAGHTLTLPETPLHNHPVRAVSAAGTATAPSAGSGFAPDGSAHPTKTYDSTAAAGPAMAATLIQNGGSSQAHENRMPYLVVNFCIALQGIFPSRN
jgi:microcystin-dependent protein